MPAKAVQANNHRQEYNDTGVQNSPVVCDAVTQCHPWARAPRVAAKSTQTDSGEAEMTIPAKLPTSRGGEQQRLVAEGRIGLHGAQLRTHPRV